MHGPTDKPLQVHGIVYDFMTGSFKDLGLTVLVTTTLMTYTGLENPVYDLAQHPPKVVNPVTIHLNNRMSKNKKNLFSNIKYDLPSGLVVYLVALPLSLGVALASTGRSDLLFSGIISGIVGGIVVGAISGSSLGVAGAAAGLVVIVFNALETLGSFEAFLLAVVLAGNIAGYCRLFESGDHRILFPILRYQGNARGNRYHVDFKRNTSCVRLRRRFYGR